jgi:hypothetical protein
LCRKERKAIWSAHILADSAQRESLPSCTVLFIPFSADYCNPAFDWAAACAEQIIRCCPKCLCDSIIGHGRRRKQAHDENHDWIKIRRGICPPCGLTFTFLPLFSKPYTHYSLVARSEALRRYFLEHCSWDNAAPSIKDPDRIPAPSTLRRWFCRLDSSRSAFSFLRPTMEVVGQWLARGEQLDCGSLRLSWPTLFPFLQVFWPLRL